MAASGSQPASDAEHDDEARHHLQHHVARHHVGEETDRQAHRPDEIGHDLDQHDERQEAQPERRDGTKSLR